MSLKMRVAVLTHEQVESKPRGYWARETILKWLEDQGFDRKRPIRKAHNWVTKSFHFVQTEELERRIYGRME